MLLKIFGAIDIFIGVMFWLFGVLNYINVHLISGGFIWFLGAVLLIKGLVFLVGMDFMTFLDLASGGLIIWASYGGFPMIIICLISLYLVQKGFFSWIG